MQTTTSHSPNAASQRRSVVGTGAAESVAAVPGAGGILDRPLPKQRGEVSESAYLYLFSEVVQYCQTRAQTPDEFKERLAAVGHGMGVRCAELLAFRSTRLQRFTDLTEALKFVSSTAWKALFGKDADGLEKVTGSKSTCLFWLRVSFLWMQKHVNTHTHTKYRLHLGRLAAHQQIRCQGRQCNVCSLCCRHCAGNLGRCFFRLLFFSFLHFLSQSHNAPSYPAMETARQGDTSAVCNQPQQHSQCQDVHPRAGSRGG